MSYWKNYGQRVVATIPAIVLLATPRAANATPDPVTPRTSVGSPDFRHCEVVGPPQSSVKFCLNGSIGSASESRASRPARGPEGSELVVVRSASFVEDFVRFVSPPRAKWLSYQVAMPLGWRLIETRNTLSIEDGQGTVQMQTERPWLLDAQGQKHDIQIHGWCSGADPSDCEIIVDWSTLAPEYPIVVDPQWQLAPLGMCLGRQFHTASVIGSSSAYGAGMVLIAGGLDDDGQPTALVELFDPATKELRKCASMAQPRAYHTATWVSTPSSTGTSVGKFLIVGGYTSCKDQSCLSADEMPPLNTYELYDPVDNCSSPAVCKDCDCQPGTSVAQPLPDGFSRAEHTATVLNSNLDAGTGIVLVAGGTEVSGATALMFYPQGTWSVSSFEIPARFGHTATYLNLKGGDISTGVVFIAGGSTARLSTTVAAPATEDLVLRILGGKPKSVPRPIGSTTQQSRPARTHSAGLLDGSRVLLWGGADTTSPAVVDFAPYFANGGNSDPKWSDLVPPADVPSTKYAAIVDTAAMPTLHGTLLVGGVVRGTCNSSTSAPYYSGITWNAVVANLQSSRVNHTLTPILSGKSLVAIGGARQSGPCNKTPLNTIETLAIVEPGMPCAQDTECVTSHCVDGVCCYTACAHDVGSATECQYCASDGTCKVRDAGVTCGAPKPGCQARTCDGVHQICPVQDASKCAVDPNGNVAGSAGASSRSNPIAGVAGTAAGGTGNTAGSGAGAYAGGGGGGGAAGASGSGGIGAGGAASLSGGTSSGLGGTVVQTISSVSDRRVSFMSCSLRDHSNDAGRLLCLIGVVLGLLRKAQSKRPQSSRRST